MARPLIFRYFSSCSIPRASALRTSINESGESNSLSSERLLSLCSKYTLTRTIHSSRSHLFNYFKALQADAFNLFRNLILRLFITRGTPFVGHSVTSLQSVVLAEITLLPDAVCAGSLLLARSFPPASGRGWHRSLWHYPPDRIGPMDF